MATRKEIRRQVGANLKGGLAPVFPQARSARTFYVPSVHVLADYAGGFIYYKGESRQLDVLEFGGAAQLLTLKGPGFSSFIYDEKAELWGIAWHPDGVNEYINSALTYAHGSIYEPHNTTEKPIIYHTLAGTDRRIAIPETMDMVRAIQYRSRYVWSPVVPHQHKWEGTGVTVVFDDHDYRVRPSVRITAPAVDMKATTGQTLDLSGMTQLEGWMKSDVARTFNVEFYDGEVSRGGVAVSLEAREWTYLRNPLPADRNSLREIDNVRLVNITPGTGTLWTNGLWAINTDSIEWEDMDNRRWEVDRNTKELLIQLPNQGRGRAWVAGFAGSFGGGYYGTSYMSYANPLENVVRVLGGYDPTPLLQDDDETVVPAAFVATKATQLAFGSESGGPQTDLDRLREQQRIWDLRAEREKRRFPALFNIRRVR